MFSFYKTRYTELYTTIAKLSREKMFYDDIKLEFPPMTMLLALLEFSNW